MVRHEHERMDGHAVVASETLKQLQEIVVVSGRPEYRGAIVATLDDVGAETHDKDATSSRHDDDGEQDLVPPDSEENRAIQLIGWSKCAYRRPSENAPIATVSDTHLTPI